MKDLRPDDIVDFSHGRPKVIHIYEDGTMTVLPLVFKNPLEWAKWWTRQAELNADLNLPEEVKLIFAEILKESWRWKNEKGLV